MALFEIKNTLLAGSKKQDLGAITSVIAPKNIDLGPITSVIAPKILDLGSITSDSPGQIGLYALIPTAKWGCR